MTGWVAFALLAINVAQDPGAIDEKRLAKRLEERFARQSKAYHFALDTDGKHPLERHDRPIMRWTADGNYGAVWIWTERGRPQLVGCIGAFQNNAGQLEGFYEFQLLSTKPIPATNIGNDYRWEPSQGGPAPKPLADAPAPVATTRLRALQMRQLAREFSADMKSGEQIHHLRLSSTPLFEYQSRDDEAVEGALFSFLWDKGTDPELLLLIELRKTMDGPRWFYVPARFTWRELTLRHGDTVLWQEEAQVESRTARHLRKPYVSCPVGTINLAADGEEARDVSQ